LPIGHLVIITKTTTAKAHIIAIPIMLIVFPLVPEIILPEQSYQRKKFLQCGKN
jgi:hypothetical protein